MTIYNFVVSANFTKCDGVYHINFVPHISYIFTQNFVIFFLISLFESEITSNLAAPNAATSTVLRRKVKKETGSEQL